MDLKKNDESLFEFAKMYYWTLLNYITAYRVISTELIQGKEGKLKNQE